MLSEEALGELPVGLELIATAEDGVNPIGIAGAMPIGSVVHHFAGTHTLVLVDLPEDNRSVTGGTEMVALADGLEAALIAKELAEEQTEGAVLREALSDQGEREAENL